ncbi:cyclopropane-fatty-acyl-phospholipid synthase family protein [Paremcibacter congregatus]|uniref:cyclopropane-fatty-acyl-phospholipid synthase family protein n=1 Tax=Paremcibacter congregatus TaxID=2043170 RepID=UPI0030ED3F83
MDGTCYKSPVKTTVNAPKNTLERLFTTALSHLKYGVLTVTFPSGNIYCFKGTQNQASENLLSADMTLHSWSVVSRILQDGDIGLGESYMKDEWQTSDLTALLHLLAENMEQGETLLPALSGLRILDKIRLFLNRNSRKGSQKNIAHHYDLGNDFYELWLDDSMTYSAALYTEPDMTLKAAQTEKYRQIAEKIGITAGDHILEIGCGWGGFAEFILQEYDCRITGLTLSKQQLAYARSRLDKCGLADRADLRLQDYRDTQGCFDHIVSIEMLEAVGEEYWPTYFNKIRTLLKPEGQVAIQVITLQDHRFERYRNRLDFIQKYIFPGGLLPSDARFQNVRQASGLDLTGQHSFGQDYARTLKAWRHSFSAARDKIEAMGFSKNFIRMWLFYLSYCEAGFQQKNIDVKHYFLAHPPISPEMNGGEKS